MYINIPKNPRVFAADLRIAHTSKDRRRACQSEQLSPADRWIQLDGPEAVASYGGARIAARSYGGDGTGSYERVCLDVLWPDLTREDSGRIHGARVAIAKLPTATSRGVGPGKTIDGYRTSLARPSPPEEQFSVGVNAFLQQLRRPRTTPRLRG